MADWGIAAAPAGPAQPPQPRAIPGVDWSLASAQPAAVKKGAGVTHDPAMVRKAEAAMEWAALSPAGRGADALLNATSRASTAAIAGRNPAKAIVDPAHATETTHAAERNLGLPIFQDVNQPFKGPFHAAAQAGEDFLFETGVDPATYVPGLDLFSVGKRVLGLGKLGAKVAGKVPGVAKAATAVATSPVGQGAAHVVDRIKSGVVEGHDLRKGVQRPGEDIVKGHEIAGSNVLRRQEQTYGDLIERNRPELEHYEQVRSELRNEMADPHWAELAKNGSQTARDRLENLRKQYNEAQGLFPPEVRTALLQRAYREGSPEVRRQVLAKGYVPTAEDRTLPALNILHHFNDEYEPTQSLYKEVRAGDGSAIDLTGGPVRYVRQGNKKAAFDLPKMGGTPEDPLVDRTLDRLVRGARLETYYTTRRNILGDLGLTGVTQAQIERTQGRLALAKANGDTRAQQLYGDVLNRQVAAWNAAEKKRATTLQPGAPAAEQKIEMLDPETARRMALRDAAVAGSPLTKVVTKKGVAQAVPVKPGDTTQDTRFIAGQLQARQGAATQAERVAAAAQNAAQQGQRGATTLLGRALAAKADTENRARRALIPPPKPAAVPNPFAAVTNPEARAAMVDAQGRPLFNASQPGALVGRRVRLPIAEVRRRLNPQGDVPSLTTPPMQAAGLVDAAGNAKRILTPAERQVAGITQPITSLTGNIRNLEARSPFQKAAEAGQTAAQRAADAEVRTGARLTTAKERNAAIEQMREVGDEIAGTRNTVSMPAAVQQRLFGTIPRYQESLLGAFSDLQRDALFVLPFAHQKNISVLAALGPGGARTVARGIQYSRQLAKDPEALAQRVADLERVGATQHYIRDVDPVYSKVPVVGKAIGGFAERTNKSLERYDLGMRLALQDELARKGVTGMAAGGQIRDVLGDYRNQAPVVAELKKRLGANFPGWGLGIVPRAMTKAVREQPRAAKAYARSQRLASDDVTEPAFGGETDLGGPAEDMAKMVTAPFSFMKSPSRTGALGLIWSGDEARRQGQLGRFAETQALRVMPFGSAISAATSFPYPSNAPQAVRLGAGLGGVYFPNRPTLKQRSAQLSALGMKGPELQAVLRSEGYLAAPAAAPAGGSLWSTAR